MLQYQILVLQMVALLGRHSLDEPDMTNDYPAAWFSFGSAPGIAVGESAEVVL